MARHLILLLTTANLWLLARLIESPATVPPDSVQRKWATTPRLRHIAQLAGGTQLASESHCVRSRLCRGSRDRIDSQCAAHIAAPRGWGRPMSKSPTTT